MTTKSAKFTGPVCSFCGVKEEECDILLRAENDKIFICDQCVKTLTAYFGVQELARRAWDCV